MIRKKHGRVTIKGADGKEHSGYYHVENDWITVSAQGTTKLVQLLMDGWSGK